MPQRFQIDSQIKEIMRYGENPHQAAAFYSNPSNSNLNLGNFEMHSGKALSYNNYIDLDSALRLVRIFQQMMARIPFCLCYCQA